MKALKFYTMAVVVALCCAACSKTKMAPVSEKINGPLGEFFEVVSRDYVVKDERVSIEIKRIKEGFPAPWQEGMEVGYDNGRFEPCFIVEYKDEDGNVVSTNETDIVFDEEALEAIAALGVGESASIQFYGPDDATMFKMGSTFKVHPKREVSHNASENGKSVDTSSYDERLSERELTESDMSGLSKSELEIMRNMIYAKYGYKFKRNDLLEYFSQFSWYDPANSDAASVYSLMSDIEKYNVEFIKKYEAKASDHSADSDSYRTSSSGSSSSADSENWDSFLDSYEQLVDQYIEFAKKADKDDQAALEEFAAFQVKYVEFSKKLGGAKGSMTPAQWGRYIAITAKQARVAQYMK